MGSQEDSFGTMEEDLNFRVRFGDMQEDEKEYLLRNGFVREDSQGELYGEPSTIIDDSVMETEEGGDVPENQTDQRGEVLFHVGDIAVTSPLVTKPLSVEVVESDNAAVGTSNQLPEFDISRVSNASMAEQDHDQSWMSARSKMEDDVGKQLVEDESMEGHMNNTELEYSTPETSYYNITPPEIDCETPPAVNPESELLFSEESPNADNNSHNNTNTSNGVESGEDLDDTIARMDKLLAMADELELADAEDAKRNEEIEAELARNGSRSGRPIPASPAPKPSGHSHSEMDLNNPGFQGEFKTPFLPTPGKRIQKRANYCSPTAASAARSVTKVSPSSSRSGIPAKVLSSTPKLPCVRSLNSMLASPLSTIGSPTPQKLALGKVPSSLPLPILLKKTNCGTPSNSKFLEKRKLLSDAPVSSPVARYIYSTPTPPMIKRAIKTECPPERRAEKSVSSIPRAVIVGNTFSGIPRFQTLGQSQSIGKLSESAYNQKLNLKPNERTGFKIGPQKELKLVNYQGSTPSSLEKTVIGASTLASTPRIDVAKSKENESFIAQRHTGLRNTNTNESIVQHSSVDKKFFPNRMKE